MVNKAALGVIGVIVIVTVGGGLVLGTMLDGGGDDNEGGAEEPTADETATPTPNDAGGSVDESTAGPADDRRTPMVPRRFESGAIEENVTRLINEERDNETVQTAEGENVTLEPFTTEGSTVERLHTIAYEHSTGMADAGRTGHAVADTNVSQRYQRTDLVQTCKYSDGISVYPPDDRFEVVNAGTIGNYDWGGEEEPYVENESMAARLIVEDIFDDWGNERRLHNPHFERMGVGAEITEENVVYVTANLCS